MLPVADLDTEWRFYEQQLGIVPGVFDAGRLRAVWIKDPDGNTMALTQVSA